MLLGLGRGREGEVTEWQGRVGEAKGGQREEGKGAPTTRSSPVPPAIA